VSVALTAAAAFACRHAFALGGGRLPGDSSCSLGGDGRLPDADPMVEGFLRASSLRPDPMKPLCWHLDGEQCPLAGAECVYECCNGGSATAVIREYRFVLDQCSASH
jgi:hypothetical protein